MAGARHGSGAPAEQISHAGTVRIWGCSAAYLPTACLLAASRACHEAYPVRPVHPPIPVVQLWLEGGGGNANFLYGMTLLWGGLQTLLLLQLLRSAARQEGGGRTGGAGEGAAVQAAGGSGQKDD